MEIIQGYFILDKVEITEEYQKQLNQIKKQYLIEWDLICEKDGRELYLGVLRDSSKIEDSIATDEEGINYGLLTVMKERNPQVIGVWKMDGTPLGMTKNVTPAVYDDEENLISERIEEIKGEATYPFNKDVYMPFMDDIVTYDEDGNELSRTRPTEPHPIRIFSGFKSPKMD